MLAPQAINTASTRNGDHNGGLRLEPENSHAEPYLQCGSIAGGCGGGLRTPVLTCHIARQYWGASDLACELPCWPVPTVTQSRGVVAVTCGLQCRPKFKIPSLPPVQRRNPAQPEVCLAFVPDSTIASPDVPFFPSYTNLQ